MSITREVIGGIGAALVAYTINKLLLKLLGEKSIVFMVPLSEEIAKTSSAILLGGWIPGVHLVFGIIEAFYDFHHGQVKKIAIFAALISVISHSLFGIMTNYFYGWTDGLVLAILIVAIIHGLWNYYVTR